jgi:negative regulator of sigma E activity
MTDTRELLSALIDREPVEPDVLAALLKEPSNRALLVDFVRLRQLMNAEHEPTQAASHRLWTHRSSAWTRIAAAVLLVAMSAGVGAWLQHYSSIERPPLPVRVVRLDPVDPR